MSIWEDIKRYQDTLSYASSKVDYSVGENIYMLPCDMNLKIRSGTVEHNNKILVSDGKFSLGKNDNVNAPAMKNRKALAQTTNSNEAQAQKPTITHKNQKPPGPQTITHNDEKLLWYFFWQMVLQYGICLRHFCMGHPLRNHIDHMSIIN